MAGACAQSSIHARHKGIQNIIGHEGLDGAGKAAAMDPVSAPALEVMLAEGQGHRHILVGLVAGGDHILQIHPGGAAGFLDQRQEGVKIALFQGFHLLGDPGIVLVEVDAPHHRPVAAGLPQGGNVGIEIGFLDLGQHFLAEPVGHRPDLPGDSGVFVGQVGMAGPGVDDAQGVAAGGEIKVDGADGRLVLVKEVDGHQAAHSGGRLIHQAAGLAEKHIFRVLADLGDLRLGNPAVKEQVVDDGADEHLVGGGGAEAGARQHRGLAVGIEALDLTAQLHEPGRHAPDQSGSGIDLVFHGGQILQIHFTQGVTLGLDADDVGAVGPHRRHGVQIHRAGQDPAPLMVRVVAADLRPAGSGKISGSYSSKHILESII